MKTFLEKLMMLFQNRSLEAIHEESTPQPPPIEQKEEQQQLQFFAPGGEPPSIELRLDRLNPQNPKSPYFGFIGNSRAVSKLIRIDCDALGKWNHVCNEVSVAFVGKAGVGKTDLARRHARANCLPLVEISPQSVKKVQDVFDMIKATCEKNGMRLVGKKNFIIPPINVFIDEVHALSAPVIQGLLKATEHNDSQLVTEKNIVADTKRVHWMIATTDRGELIGPFDTRFVKVILNLYTKDEIAQIVRRTNHDWNEEPANLAAFYCSKVPREALAFAREMQMEKKVTQHDWAEVAKRVAQDNEIDEFGMTFKRLAILRALKDGPMGSKRLPVVAGVEQKELDKFIMPWLLETTTDQPALAAIGPRGYYLTEEGKKELERR